MPSDTNQSSLHSPEPKRYLWAQSLFWLLGILLVAWVGHEAFTTQVITAYITSDFWEHSATFRALLEDGLIPSAPHENSDASSPRYMPHYLLLALAAKALSLDALGAMALSSTVNMVLLVLGCLVFFTTLFQDPRAPLYGLIVMLGSWYAGWHFSNVYQLQWLPSVASYPSQAVVAVTLFTLAAGVQVMRSTTTPWLSLLVCSLLSFYALLSHPLTAMAPLAGLFFLALSWPDADRNRRLALLGALIAGCLLTLAWPHFSVFEVLFGKPGGQGTWINESLRQANADDAKSLHEFYILPDLAKTLGLAMLGAVAAVYFVFSRSQYAFIGFGALAMLLPFVVNPFVPIPLGHRFILLSIIFLHIALVWLLLRLSPGFRDGEHLVMQDRPAWQQRSAGLLVAVLLSLMSGYNLWLADQRMSKELSQRTPGRPSDVVTIARDTAEKAGKDAVFIGDRSLLWPIPTFGPKVLIGAHINPLIKDKHAREEANEVFFHADTSTAVRRAIIEEYGITHVQVHAGTAMKLKNFLQRYAGPPQPLLVQGFYLFKLKD